MLTRRAHLVEQEIPSVKLAGVDKAQDKADFPEEDPGVAEDLALALFRDKAVEVQVEEAEEAGEEAVRAEADGKSRLATEWARCGERSESCGRQ